MAVTPQKIGKLTRFKKRLLVVATFSVPLFLTSGVSSQSQQVLCTDATADNQTISQCLANHGANNSWLMWLSGNSRSTQFQLIDLFELVNRPSDNLPNSVIPTREG